jgi:hypothetical protein
MTSHGSSRLLSSWIRAGASTAVIDGLFSSVLVAVFYGSTVTRLWQGVASVLVGPRAIDGGAPMTLLGLLMHITVAFFWSGVFGLLVAQVPAVRRLLMSPLGVITIAAVYGPIIWMVMSFALTPALTHRPPAVNFRWWVQFFGHIPFVAVPITWSFHRGVPR